MALNLLQTERVHASEEAAHRREKIKSKDKTPV
jgi:hypothetical protein